MSFFNTEKYTWADKAAFFVILVAGLLIAHLIVIKRSVMEFSKPVELEHMGVSVSVPIGNGWESDEQWRYAENNFTISSFFNPGHINPEAAVHCRYFLAALEKNPEAQIEQKTRIFGGTIEEKGVMPAHSLIVNWARINVPAAATRAAFKMLFGTVQLPDGRIVNVEVRWSALQKAAAKKIFEHIVNGFEFRQSQAQRCGDEIIGSLKADGIGRLLTERNKQTYFVIKDTKALPIGYVIDILADLGRQAPMNIQAASSFYVRGRRGREQVIIFQGRDDLSEFICKGEGAGRFGRSGFEAVFDRTGVLAVKEYGTFIFGVRPEGQIAEPIEERFYRPGPASIPDVMAELIYDKILSSKCDKVLIDVIKADGAIIPAVISRMENTSNAADKDGFMLKIDLLDGRNSYVQTYLDRQRQVYKEVVRQNETYILEKSSPEELKKLFPEKSGDILKPKE